MAGGWGGGWDDGLDEEEEEQQGGKGFNVTKDCVILLVDASKQMFTPSSSGEVPFELCLKCARSVMLNKIVSSEKDLVSIVFFGTKQFKNSSDFEHIYILQELDMPDAPRVKQLEEMLDDEGFVSFSQEYGHSNDYSLSDVFWICSSIFSNSGAKFSHKRILLFTNNDNPHQYNNSLQTKTKTKASDLAGNGIEIELLPLGRDFDVATFYQDIIFTGDDEITPLPNPSEKFEELLTRVRSKEFKKRTMQRITLSLGPGLELGVGVYCLVRETKKPSFVRLDQRTNEELKTQTKMLCEDTGTVLMPTDIKYYQMFGGSQVIFEKEEVNEMKDFGPTGLTLMGFKPKSKIKWQQYIKPANFIYPDETIVSGSSKLFSALLQRCLARDVVAICRYIPRTNAAPSFVALLPQEEEIDENQVQVCPPGFHVVFLPYAEDVRKLQLPEMEEGDKATNEQVDKAKEIVKKLMFKFKSESFENPVLQKHYHVLEALALDHEEEEEMTDFTVPDVERIDRRAGAVIDEFKQMVFPPGYNPEGKGTGGSKRKASSSSGDAAAKRARPSSSSDPADVEKAAREGTLKKLTVPVLKDYLKSIGGKTTGKKQDLMDAITEHLEL